MHQNIPEKENDTLKSVDSSDNFKTISLSVSYSSKCIRVEDNDIEQTSYESNIEKDNSNNQNHEKNEDLTKNNKYQKIIQNNKKGKESVNRSLQSSLRSRDLMNTNEEEK
ncbi:32369_t:CDS:1 [Racocetra persica]|uniref:32369_t:CDS:1 n=1 Tax=Racocetra persica TaxID=160502 RepID=A0ACA9P4N7_9GLOM|nr:32369_t:CDS:1 [Racocetra persica]